MSEEIIKTKLKTHLWGSAKFLRNKIDAGDYKAYIFPLMFYKRICDVYDEEFQKCLEESNGDKDYALSEVNHQFQIPKGCHWNDVRKTSKHVGQKILKSMRQIEKANPSSLFGIFGDANWGNKDRLSDETLIDLLEHFSSLNLSTKSVSNDLMGDSYEFLIKKFADDSGHTAAEFYTNRTVVTLMTNLLDPQPNESIYDPTCGTGGMILECINYLKRNNKDFRTLSLFGQEKNIITSGIARMNMLLHGFEDAKIMRGDTLHEPLLLTGDKLKEFDVILANPPYSINIWNRKAWSRDPYGRNIYGTPPQGRADYAFIQHIVSSLDKKGRAAILLPHGVLFRDGENEIRKKLVNDDQLEAVIGLPKDMFYNSVMESCILIFRKNKDSIKQNNVIFINAIKEFERKNNKNFLNEKHIEKISNSFKKFENSNDFAYVANIDEIKSNNYLLSIPMYVKHKVTEKIPETKFVVEEWLKSHNAIVNSFSEILVGVN